MPIPRDKFEEGGIAQRKKIQDNILRVLQSNPDNAFSSRDLENMFNTRRQAIIQAIHGLERQDLIERGFIMEENRLITYVIIKEEK